MIRRRAVTIAFATVVLAGLLPEPAHATHLRWMLVKPPVGTSDAHMNQGWHSPSNGIDWDDEDGSGTCCGVGRDIYLNAWLYRDSATTSYIAWVDYYQSNLPNCTRFRARLKEYTDLTRITGYLNYRHAYEGSVSNHGMQGNSAGLQEREIIGIMQLGSDRDPDWDTCGWSNVHVHAEQTSGTWGTWTRNVGSAPGAIPTGTAQWTYHNISQENAVTERRLDWCNPVGIC